VIETEEENERLLALVENLMAKGDNLSPEEDKLDLLVTLIEKFEDEHYQLNASTHSYSPALNGGSRSQTIRSSGHPWLQGCYLRSHQWKRESAKLKPKL
jgi:hypothetical protein